MKFLDLNCSFKAIRKRIFSGELIPTKYRDIYPLFLYIEIQKKCYN